MPLCEQSFTMEYYTMCKILKSKVFQLHSYHFTEKKKKCKYSIQCKGFIFYLPSVITLFYELIKLTECSPSTIRKIKKDTLFSFFCLFFLFFPSLYKRVRKTKKNLHYTSRSGFNGAFTKY